MADLTSPTCQIQTPQERIRRDALIRLREATPKEMAVFAEKLRMEAYDAGASESDVRDAEHRAGRLVDA